MSGNLSFPLSNERAIELVRDALVPCVTHAFEYFSWGHIDYSEDVTHGDLYGCVAVLGAFDGFHMGHAKLMRAACESAVQLGVPVVALTFWPDPSEVLGHAEGRLMNARQRVDVLLGAGASAVVTLRFDEALANLSPSAFVDLLMSLLAPKEIYVGANFRFGAKGLGTTADLAELCEARAVQVSVHELIDYAGSPVSATRIRTLIAEGNIDDVLTLMGRPLCLTGTVVHGRGEGSGFGFATANLEVETERVLLAPGVYAGYTVVNGIAWPTAANAGSPASFGGGADNLIEAHLLGFSEAIYGEIAAFVPICMLRAEQVFKSHEELVQTVRGNIDWVARNLGTQELGV